MDETNISQIAKVLRLTADREETRREAFAVLVDEATRMVATTGVAFYAEWVLLDAEFRERLAEAGWRCEEEAQRKELGPLTITHGRFHASARVVPDDNVMRDQLLAAAWDDEDRAELLVASLGNMGPHAVRLAVEYDTEFVLVASPALLDVPRLVERATARLPAGGICLTTRQGRVPEAEPSSGWSVQIGRDR